jgi:hypothetical protein
MQRQADAENQLEAQPLRKKIRLVAHHDRLTEAIAAALSPPQGPLNARPIVLWCIHGPHTATALALLYWPCDQLVGEQLIRALREPLGRDILVWALIEMAQGYLSDYKAAKPTLPRYGEMKQQLVARFLKPGDPLSALGHLAMMQADHDDTLPVDWSKHAIPPIKEHTLSPFLYYVHYTYNMDEEEEEEVVEEDEGEDDEATVSAEQ